MQPWPSTDPLGEQGGGDRVAAACTHLVNGGVWSHVTCTPQLRGFLFQQPPPRPRGRTSLQGCSGGVSTPEEPLRPQLG